MQGEWFGSKLCCPCSYHSRSEDAWWRPKYDLKAWLSNVHNSLLTRNFALSCYTRKAVEQGVYDEERGIGDQRCQQPQASRRQCGQVWLSCSGTSSNFTVHLSLATEVRRYPRSPSMHSPLMTKKKSAWCSRLLWKQVPLLLSSRTTGELTFVVQPHCHR